MCELQGPKIGHLGLLCGREYPNYKFHEKLQLIFLEFFLCAMPVRDFIHILSLNPHNPVNEIPLYPHFIDEKP